MRALVIGGTGFLGLNILDALRRRGASVATTRRRSSNTIFARRLGVPLRAATLDDQAALRTAMSDRDVVFMAAGHYPRYADSCEQQIDAAVRDLRTVLGAAKAEGIRRIVFTSTVSTVARPPAGVDRPAREADGLQTAVEGRCYQAIKIALEREALAAAAEGLPVVIVNPTGCLGPYDYRIGTGMLVLGPASAQPLTLVDGTINVVDARDVAEAHVTAAERGRVGERYILGDHNLTVRELVDVVGHTLGVTPHIDYLPPAQAIALAEREEARCRAEGGGRPTLSRKTVDVVLGGQAVDATRARTELGLGTRRLGTIIRDCHRWYREQGFIRYARRQLRPTPEPQKENR